MIRIGFSRYISQSLRREESQEVSANLLLVQVAKKDREALAAIYRRFQGPLFRYLFHLLGQKELAEDVLQEVMVIVWQKAHTFQRKAQAEHWIFGIAHHQAFKALRRQSGATFIALEAALDLPDEGPGPETDVLLRTTREELVRALASLSSEHREVLELAFFQDFSCKEIAAIVGIPVGTVKSRLSYARRALKAALFHNGWET